MVEKQHLGPETTYLSLFEWWLLQLMTMSTIIYQHFSNHAHKIRAVCLCDFEDIAQHLQFLLLDMLKVL